MRKYGENNLSNVIKFQCKMQAAKCFLLSWGCLILFLLRTHLLPLLRTRSFSLSLGFSKNSASIFCCSLQIDFGLLKLSIAVWLWKYYRILCFWFFILNCPSVFSTWKSQWFRQERDVRFSLRKLLWKQPVTRTSQWLKIRCFVPKSSFSCSSGHLLWWVQLRQMC